MLEAAILIRIGSIAIVPLGLPAAYVECVTRCLLADVEQEGGHACGGIGRIPVGRRFTLALLMTTGLIQALPLAAVESAFKKYMVSGLTAGPVKS